MKHASSQSLALLAPLLGNIRTRAGLIEKKPGIFYRNSKAFLHFHEDKAGMFMDIRDAAEWVRVPVTDFAGCLAKVERIMAAG